MTPKSPPLFLLHGSAETSACWDDLLAQAEGEVGARRSNSIVGPESALLAASNLQEDVHLVGHSYGGLLALMMALEHPKHIVKLTLIEPVLFRLLQGRDDEALAPVLATRTAFSRFEEGEIEVGLEALLNYWFGPGTWKYIPEQLRQLMFADASIIHAQIEHAASYNPSPQALQRMTIPTTLICSSGTRAAARSIVRILEGLLPKVERHNVEGARHDLIRTHPRVLAELLGLRTSSTTS
jgi:pimeloyl-ACP methyl ester carboxylesterase